MGRATFLRFPAAVLMGALAAACSDDDNPTDPGDRTDASYTATVSGAVDESLSGTAFFATGTDPDTQEQAWVAYLVTDGDSPFTAGQNIGFFGLGAPQARTYVLEDISQNAEIPDDGAAALVIVYDDQSLSGLFYSTSGSLQITSVSSDRMEGTFDFSADGVTFSPGGQPVDGSISVTGSFRATTGNQFVVPPIN